MGLLKTTQRWQNSLEEYAATDFASYTGLNCVLGVLRCGVTLVQKIAGTFFSDKALEKAASENVEAALIETVPWFGGYKAKQYTGEKHSEAAKNYLEKINEILARDRKFSEYLSGSMQSVLKHPEINPTAILEKEVADLDRRIANKEKEFLQPSFKDRPSWSNNTQLNLALSGLKQRRANILNILNNSNAP